MRNFWATLPKPFFVQAPMENVTDTVFRQIIALCAKPDVFFTEFTNTNGICSEGKEKVSQRLLYTQKERPIVAQIWGTKPEYFYQSAKLLKKMQFDGIDINMGCPDKQIIKKGACSALINNPTLALEIIQATKEGAQGLPVSVKTRIGFKKVQTEEWVSFLLSQGLAALTIHARIASEMSKYPATWDEVGKAVKIKKQMKSNTLIVGNGDIISREDAHEKYEKYDVDGLMIGRGIFHNIWIFNSSSLHPSVADRLTLLKKHIELFDKTWGNSKHYEIMKKYYKIYISDIPHASEMRLELMQYKNAKDTLVAINTLLKTL